MRVRATSPVAFGTPPASRWRRVLDSTGQPALISLLLLAHIVFGISRFPAGSIQKRLESVREWRRLGADAWCFRNADDETRRVARWLVENVPPDHVVRYAGSGQGCMQLLAPLIFPALLVHNAQPQAWPSGRPVFAATAPWLPAPKGATPVVTGTPESLRLEYR